LTIPAHTADGNSISSILKERFPGVNINVLASAANVAEAIPVYMRYHRNFNQFNDVINQKAITPVFAGEVSAASALSAIKAEIDGLLKN
jgi:hypothetical protein